MSKSISTFLPDLGLEHLLYAICGVIAISSLLFLTNDTLLLHFISINTTGLKLFGTATDSHGTVFRKLISDSLQLPLNLSNQIFEDDLIITGEKSSIEITLTAGQIVSANENTVIRVRRRSDKILLEIQKGSISTKFDENSQLIVKTGLLEKNVEIKKGTTTIDSTGTTFKIFQKSADQNELPEPKDDPKKSELNPSSNAQLSTEQMDVKETDESNAQTNSDSEKELTPKEMEKLEIPTKFPHPENKIVYLINGEQTIKIIPKKICDDSCTIRIRKDGQLLIEKKFEVGEIPNYSLTVEEFTDSRFEWEFTEYNQPEQFEFTVKPFNSEIFEKLIIKNQNIEIL